MIYVLPKGGTSIKTEFAVKNEYGETVLKVEASKYSLRKRISIRDQYAIEIGHIQKKLLTPGTVYEIYHEKKLLASLKRKRWFFSKRYHITTADGDVYKARGNFKAIQYDIILGGHKVAHVSKDHAMRSENYGIAIVGRASPYICICAALIIEAVHGIYGKGK